MSGSLKVYAIVLTEANEHKLRYIIVSIKAQTLELHFQRMTIKNRIYIMCINKKKQIHIEILPEVFLELEASLSKDYIKIN